MYLNSSSTILMLFLVLVLDKMTTLNAFLVPQTVPHWSSGGLPFSRASSRLSSSSDDASNDSDNMSDPDSQSDTSDENQAWDANVDYSKEWPSEEALPDPSTSWDTISMVGMPEPKLGIDVNLPPLTQEQTDELKVKAKEIVNDEIAKGIDDIQQLREKLKDEMQQMRRVQTLESEWNTQQESQALVNKIDQLIDPLLKETEASRTSTRLAAAASRSMEGTGKGIERGTWGTLNGRSVLADTPSFLGSVDQQVAQRSETGATATATAVENRILVLADSNGVSHTSLEAHTHTAHTFSQTQLNRTYFHPHRTKSPRNSFPLSSQNFKTSLISPTFKLMSSLPQPICRWEDSTPLVCWSSVPAFPKLLPSNPHSIVYCEKQCSPMER